MAIEPKPKGNVVNYYSDNKNNPYTKESGYWISVMISNDGAADLTITINSMTQTVKAGEVLDEDYADFNSVQVNSTVAYRIWLRE